MEKTVCFKLPKNLYNELVALAEADMRNVSSYIRVLIVKAVVEAHTEGDEKQMEINEQGNYQLNRDSEHDKFAELKEQITADARADVEAYINSIGGTIVPTGYDGAKDVARLVDKYNQLKVDRDNEIERINNRYKESIAESKIKIVEENFKYDVKDLEDELDKCQAKDTFERERAIALCR